MRRVCSSWVPHLLTTEQLERHIEVCRKWESLRAANPKFFKHVITYDESRVHFFDPLLKQESATWKTQVSPRKQKVRQEPSVGKVMLIAFFDNRGLVYQHFVPANVTVNSEYYCGVLKMLHTHIAKKRPDMKRSWHLHHDNTRSHTLRFTNAFLEKFNIPCIWPGTMWFLALSRAKKKNIAQSAIQDCASENCHSNALPDIREHDEDHFDKMGRKVAVVYPEWGPIFRKKLPRYLWRQRERITRIL